MFRIIRFFITSCIVIGICSLTVDNRPVFYYIYKYSKVVVKPVQESTKDFIKISYHRTLDFSRQFFNNNLPNSDSLEFQLSAPERDDKDYSDDDRRKLDEIFE